MTSKQNQNSSSENLLGGIIAFHKDVAKKLGDNNAGIFLSQAIYWTKIIKKTNPERDGWFYKTCEDWEEETNLSYDRQLTARKICKSFGVLEEHHKKLEHKMFYRVNFVALDKLLLTETPDIGKTQLGLLQTDNLDLNTNETLPEGGVFGNSHLGRLANPVSANLEIPNSYIVTDTSSETTSINYLDKTKNILLIKTQELNNFFEEKHVDIVTSSEEIHINKEFKFDITVLKSVRNISKISDIALISVINKFIKYYSEGKGKHYSEFMLGWHEKFLGKFIGDYNRDNPQCLIKQVDPNIIHKAHKPDKSIERVPKERNLNSNLVRPVLDTSKDEWWRPEKQMMEKSYA